MLHPGLPLAKICALAAVVITMLTAANNKAAVESIATITSPSRSAVQHIFSLISLSTVHRLSRSFINYGQIGSPEPPPVLRHAAGACHESALRMNISHAEEATFANLESASQVTPPGWLTPTPRARLGWRTWVVWDDTTKR